MPDLATDDEDCTTDEEDCAALDEYCAALDNCAMADEYCAKLEEDCTAFSDEVLLTAGVIWRKLDEDGMTHIETSEELDSGIYRSI
ncbi:hypothetical protein [Fibrobacter sp.]|uniref:hypothetical protein n=1 Tax=Fibrobacter sp. TaxID=35828 RepID=UPI00386B91CE